MPEAASPHSAPPHPPKHHGTIALLLDFGPLLLFFVAYKFAGVLVGTGVFMAAIAVAVVVSKWKLGRVSPMLWLSAVLVLFFGALTLYFRDQRFIQIKPTIIYLFFGALLLGGLARGKPLLKYLLQAAYDGLSEEGWRKLSRNWALFFLAMALANETMRALLSFDQWLAVKVWGVTLVSFVFAAANLPMLMRHGLTLEDKKGTEAVGEGEPPQG